MISDYIVIACGIATNLAAVIICLSDREKPLSPRKLWRAICKDQGIDPLRLRMALNPPALPQGGGARDPRHLTQSMLEYIETLPSCTCGSGKCQRHDLRKALERIMAPGNGRDVLR